MRSISNAIIHHKKLVVVVFLVIAGICSVLLTGVTVNYSMTDYLPENAQSTQAIGILDTQFDDAIPNARVMLRDVTITEALDYKAQLAAVDGVTDVIWLDDVADLKQPIETLDPDTVGDYYKDGSAVISLTIREGDEVRVTTDIYAIIGESNALSGSGVDMASAQNLTGNETQSATLILVPVIILILLLTTTSWLEPVLYLAAIGISVLINMGTNIVFGEISFITGAVSPILQLAVSLDYAIFLLRSFEEYRKQTDDVNEAMRLAMKRAFSSVTASAATTFFGFLALVFMKFQIGSDLGIVLVKGIVLSFISVMVFLPALTLTAYKLLDKTRHRKFLPEFKRVGNVAKKLRIPALILVLIVIVPSYLGQRNNDFSYGTAKLAEGSRVSVDTDATNEAFGRETPIVLLVPRGDVAREALLADELESLDHVTGIISYATTVGAAIPDDFVGDDITGRFYSDDYARIIVYTDTADEGTIAFSTVESVLNTAEDYYPDGVYAAGSSVTMYDMRTVVTADNRLVNLIAIAAILLVLLITFKSLTLPLILIVTIETAIWVNLSIPYFTGDKMVFIGYLVLNTVQLGATVDYAILLTNHYTQHRREMGKFQALKLTFSEVFESILTSGSILALAGFALFVTSTNQIVAEMGLLLGRGTLLSMGLVLFFLPAALTLFDKAIQKTTLHSGFLRSDKS